MRKSLLTAASLLGIIFAAPAADAPKTQMVVPGKSLVTDDLSKGFGADWKVAKGKWIATDGGVKGAEIKDDMHGAVARINAKFRDAVVAISFKLEGTKGTSLSLNGTKGHICRVAISPTKFSVNKDDQDGKDGPDKGEVLSTCTVAIKPGEWHTMVVEFRGPDMFATLDGQHHCYGRHEAIDKEKTNLGLTCAGEFVMFKNLTIHEATQHPDWEKNKSKYTK